uniref:Secreted protein n=1 Tax=Ixodes ricinus TaxID=34613 RepID=A0A6B0UHN4_IXORI
MEHFYGSCSLIWALFISVVTSQCNAVRSTDAVLASILSGVFPVFPASSFGSLGFRLTTRHRVIDVLVATVAVVRYTLTSPSSVGSVRAPWAHFW